MKEIKLQISEDNEGTDSPYWMIIDPRQMMKPDVYAVSSMITGPFFSREDAQEHVEARAHAFSSKVKVFCFSGYWSRQYKNVCREAGI